MTIGEVSKAFGLSKRTLRYYDSIGLFCSTGRAKNGSREYSETDIARLRQIMMYRKLEFSLVEIAVLLNTSAEERNAAMEKHIDLLRQRREELDRLIGFACTVREKGEDALPFSEVREDAEEDINESDLIRYTRECDSPDPDLKQKQKRLGAECTSLFRQFGNCKHCGPDSPEASILVQKLRDDISKSFCTCIDETLIRIGQMYAIDGTLRQDIDAIGGEGTAEFVSEAIIAECLKRRSRKRRVNHPIA